MLTEEMMKLTRHYQLYVSIFRVDVPTTKSQPIESTQGTHRTLSAPRIPNPVTTQSESSAPRKPTIIGFRVPIQPEPETPIPTAAEIDIDSLYEATRLSIATQRSLEDLESQQNVEKVQEHMDEEYIEKIVEGGDNVDEDNANVLTTNDDDEEEESARDELIPRKREKGKRIEEIRDTSLPTPIRSPRTHIAPLSSDKETLQELTASDHTPSSSTPKPKQDRFKHYKSVFHKKSRRYGYMFRHLKQSFMPRKEFA
ncbi:hypothetical protein Tco_1053449 [Tanacetum coccineum]